MARYVISQTERMTQALIDPVGYDLRLRRESLKEGSSETRVPRNLRSAKTSSQSLTMYFNPEDAVVSDPH